MRGVVCHKRQVVRLGYGSNEHVIRTDRGARSLKRDPDVRISGGLLLRPGQKGNEIGEQSNQRSNALRFFFLAPYNASAYVTDEMQIVSTLRMNRSRNPA